jgi:hypothetical protein
MKRSQASSLLGVGTQQQGSRPQRGAAGHAEQKSPGGEPALERTPLAQLHIVAPFDHGQGKKHRARKPTRRRKAQRMQVLSASNRTLSRRRATQTSRRALPRHRPSRLRGRSRAPAAAAGSGRGQIQARRRAERLAAAQAPHQPLLGCAESRGWAENRGCQHQMGCSQHTLEACLLCCS